MAHGFTSSRPSCGDPLILGLYETGEHELDCAVAEAPHVIVDGKER